MLPIQQKFIEFNFNKGRCNSSIRYIVIHDTGNIGIKANAMAHFIYFNGGDRNASAHYFVDDGSIIQLVSDENTSWHCGDGGGKYGITNANSLGIEICINCDGNYDKAVSNTIDLTKYLMNKYNIDVDHVVRHWDASKKQCPNSMSKNNWEKWNWFKSQLTEATAAVVQSENKNLIRVQVGAFSDEKNADDMISRLKAAGFDGAFKVR